MKKTVKKKVAKKKSRVFLNRLPKNRGELLMLMIKFTKRAITSPIHQKYLIDQVERLEKELYEWTQEYNA